MSSLEAIFIMMIGIVLLQFVYEHRVLKKIYLIFEKLTKLIYSQIKYRPRMEEHCGQAKRSPYPACHWLFSQIFIPNLQ